MWDETDAAADPYLHAAILLGLGLATRGRTVGDQGDLEALRDIEGRIEDELQRLEKMEKHTEGIRKNSMASPTRSERHNASSTSCFRRQRAPSPHLTSNSTRRTSNGPLPLPCIIPTRLLP